MNNFEDRLRRVEDMLAIQQLIASYGPAADSCNTELLERIWAKDAIYDVGGLGLYVDHAGLRTAYDGEFHQDIVAHGSSHASTMPYIVIDGDRASATHYGTLFTQRDGAFKLNRLIASRWILRRTADGAWEVESRTNRLLDGGDQAKDLLKRVEEGPSSEPEIKHP